MNSVNFDQLGGLGINEFAKKADLLRSIRNNFLTFGYQEIETPTFESYDFYQKINGTVDYDNMVKIIDPSGKILVMRPDVTIPITKMQVSTSANRPSNNRLFYMENVFRFADGHQQKKEWTQAGIENFAPCSIETDAEVIALAVKVLRSLEFDSIQVQIGLASFIRPLLTQLSLSKQETKEIQSLIQAKNISELELFLTQRKIPETLHQLLLQIPYLYGAFDVVIEHAKELTLNDSMRKELEKLEALHQILILYNVDQFVSLDLGLINHMNYYSGITFQGYVENVGKPVLMGGRYDELASQMGRSLPAIGFACEGDLLLEALDQKRSYRTKDFPDAFVTYDSERQKEAIQTVETLRNKGKKVTLLAPSEKTPFTKGTTFIRYKQFDQVVEKDGKSWSFSTTGVLLEKLFREGT